MFDRPEFAYRFADPARLNLTEHSYAAGSQHILNVMSAFQGNFRNLHNFALTAGVAEINTSIANVSSLVNLFFAAEPENIGLGARRHTNAGWIISIQHCEVARFLVLEDPGLGIGISFKSAM